MTALVIGADGAIGSALMAALKKQRIDALGTSRRADSKQRGSYRYLDLSDMRPDMLELPKTKVAFFCAAMSRFADCDAHPELASRINVDSPVALARRLAANGTRVILLSTSAVFDGRTPRVLATQPTCPQTEYGRLKAAAERKFLSLGDAACVLRLTKVLDRKYALLSRWRSELAAGQSVSAFADLGMAPITMEHATNALIAVARSELGGIFQVSAVSDITYFDAARHIAGRVGAEPTQVVSQSGRDAGIPPEQLTRYSSLDTTRLSALTGVPAPDPLEAVEQSISP